MKRLERKILQTLAMHAKKLRECTGKRIKPVRGNEKTSRSLLHKAFPGRGRVTGLQEGEQAIHVPMGKDRPLG
jgi:hypothetical protein